MTNLNLYLIALIVLVSGFVSAVVLWRVFRDRARLRHSLDVVMFQVALPKDLQKDEREEGVGEPIKERIAVAEQWLSTLTSLPIAWWEKFIYGQPVVVLEIVAQPDGKIVFLVGTERRFSDHLEKQIYAFYPEAEVIVAPEGTLFNEGDSVQMRSLGLSAKSHLPIATYKELEADPMQSITGALAKIQNGDAAAVQLIIKAAGRKTQRRGKAMAHQTISGKRNLDLLTKSVEEKDKAEADRAKLTPRAEERVQLVEAKLSQPQFEVTGRLVVATRSADDAERVMNAMVGALSQYDLPDLNRIKAKNVRQRGGALRRFIFRVPNEKSSLVLSTTELSSLFHFPLPTTATPNILWRGAKVAPAAADMPSEGVMLGVNNYRGVETPIYLQEDDRRRHLYLIGQTGTGKTTLFLNMITQDIAAGHGVAVVDPHGDLIEDIMLHIPPERQKDVILFDPKDTEKPLGFNILETSDPGQKDLVVNEVVNILQKLAARLNPESIGPMFEHYLRNSLMALAEDPNATLLDVPRMFVDEGFRKKILELPLDPTVRQFWEKEFAQSQKGQMSADMLSYVISKLGRFIGNALVRNMLGQAQSSFDVREVMDQRKILLCNLSKGHLGDINADLLGFVLVSKIQIAALGRANVSEDRRPDFYLYLDEFQNFTTDSIATILSEARKYRLNLNLTHQFIQQLEDNIKEAVFGNVGTVVSYRIGVDDAEFMAQQFDPVFTEYDLVNLDRFTAVVRPLVNGAPARPFSLKIPPPPADGDVQGREAIREFSRNTYGRSKTDVEMDILERFKFGEEKKESAAGGSDEDYLSESLFDVS